MISNYASHARLVSAYCPEYPEAFCDLADAPCVFRVVGELPVLRRTIAIVGTRRADDEALDYAHTIAREAALRGIVVVSGGAVGIDRAAHEGAIEGGGRTIVVLPTGLDAPYPDSNADLFARVVQAGCLLTETDDGAPPQSGRFLTRNRLVAVLGQSLVVVQAPARSGALSTARLARRLGRKVFAVPASPWDPRGSGNLRLLEGGARICARPADVLSDTGTAGGGVRKSPTVSAPEANDFSNLSHAEQNILHELSGRARHADELCRSTGIPAFQVQRSILRLLVRGLVEEKPGGRYQSCRARRKP